MKSKSPKPNEVFEPTIILPNAYVPCLACKGSGHEDGMWGISTCSECKGNCAVRDRDERGRFRATYETWYHIGNGEYVSTPPETFPNGSSSGNGKATVSK